MTNIISSLSRGASRKEDNLIAGSIDLLSIEVLVLAYSLEQGCSLIAHLENDSVAYSLK